MLDEDSDDEIKDVRETRSIIKLHVQSNLTDRFF